jgi:rhamnogalacturonyl hydrolase YesR
MKLNRQSKFILLLMTLLVMPHVFYGSTVQSHEWLYKALQRCKEQLFAASVKYHNSHKSLRTLEDGKVVLVDYKDWTSGFFPGSLWYMFQLTKNNTFKTEAEYYTQLLYSAQYRTNTHDLGFILNCSYGNGYRLTDNPAYKQVLITGGKSLMTRFQPQVGLIKSWDNRKKWQYPVIIDNMMNLEFLYNVGKMIHDSSMIKACISHANKTMINHFRPDYSSYHLVDYDSINGRVIHKQTVQGYSDSSAWARGQAWGLYGFTMMYRETKDKKYLIQAEKIAHFILNNPNLPSDKIPYWDFNAPDIPKAPRDASAAAVIASALIELSTYVKGNMVYLNAAETILKNLSSGKYLGAKGSNGLFILKHSTGNWPKHDEIDVPLSYADYYYIEALGRYMKVKGINQK